MPIPSPDVNYRTMALENALAKAHADIAAKDAFIAQCVDVITQQDQTINELMTASTEPETIEAEEAQ